ncbi:hypothetical protein GCWU000246_00720 [Jonquetella anthropi E3_33 E1]|nr:hypothetical protein GCWU000246_00720 [Jonquetella anthropi E3_33 E1]
MAGVEDVPVYSPGFSFNPLLLPVFHLGLFAKGAVTYADKIND